MNRIIAMIEIHANNNVAVLVFTGFHSTVGLTDTVKISQYLNKNVFHLSFHAAAHVASESSVTRSEQDIIDLLLHTRCL